MMKKYTMFLCAMSFFLCTACAQKITKTTSTTSKQEEKTEKKEYALVIHGGAGYMLPKNYPGEKGEQYILKLNEALDVGETILKNGGEAVDAVTAVITLLEDCPLFNAGKGSVYTANKTNELDASIMTGHNQEAGAVAGVTTIKNPITAARNVLDHSKHVLLVREGAEQFAKLNGCEIVDPSYFYNEDNLNRVKSAIQKEQERLEKKKTGKFGTVGCVALDKKGHIAAGTSTGGMTNKKYNRVGDSPVIGAGTYANEDVGVSCTGHGEYFIRYAVAYDVAARIKYLNETLEQASENIINGTLKEKGGNGGLIALDKYGNISMPFNTPGMFRGYVTPEKREVKMFK